MECREETLFLSLYRGRFGSMVLAMSHDLWREAPVERRRKPKKLRGSGRLSSLRYGTVAAIPLSPQYLSTQKHANMDNDLRDGQWASNYDNPVFLTSDSADPVSPAAEQADQPSGGQALPLLRLSGWDSEKQYDKHNPVYIHYDFK